MSTLDLKLMHGRTYGKRQIRQLPNTGGILGFLLTFPDNQTGKSDHAEEGQKDGKKYTTSDPDIRQAHFVNWNKLGQPPDSPKASDALAETLQHSGTLINRLCVNRRPATPVILRFQDEYMKLHGKDGVSSDPGTWCGIWLRSYASS
ncbi:MAG: hypothetical protein JJ878_03750 [Alphaproteobacteria bacterium]|nr:hypothetical protein [Alphaproteobacteria bacterium]MBO6861727.1 hypothetical protein [Alphaproteobacteria bacterium]